MSCMKLTSMLQANRGACDAMEGTARRMIAASAPPHAGYGALAEALAARGASLTSVHEALRQAEQGLDALPASVVPEAYRKRKKIVHQAVLAQLEGDFDAALRLAGEYGQTLEGSRQQSERGAFARVLAELHLEVGNDAEAGRVALDFLDRRDAWEPAPGAEDVAMAGDATPFLLLTAVRTGAMTRVDFEVQREAWRRAWRARMTPVTKNFLWLHGYAAMVDSADDARAALAALPQYQPLPPFRPEARVDAEVGRTFLLAGRAVDAVTWLERATATCYLLGRPMQHVHAVLALGDARAAKGDKAGACAAYGEVLARWGKAKPRSTSAEQARAKREALGCGG